MNQVIKYLFVYGTLKPEFSHIPFNSLLHNDKFKPTCFKAILKNFQLYMLHYCTVLSEENSFTYGYAITSEQFNEMMQVCDHIEDYPQMYDRQIVDIDLIDTKETVKGWVYFMKPGSYKKQDLKKLGHNFELTDFPYKE